MTSIHEQDKKKGERPPTGRVRKLSKSVTVKFSKPSYEALKLRARKANRKLAEYIRESALNGEVVSGHNTETVAIAKNLIGMANNLNQLTRAMVELGDLTRDGDNFKYGEEVVFTLTNNEDGTFTVSAMPAYSLEISTTSHANVYKVHYDANNGTFESNVEDTTVVFDKEFTINDATTLTRAGYTFKGWATDPVSGEVILSSVAQYVKVNADGTDAYDQ